MVLKLNNETFHRMINGLTTLAVKSIISKEIFPSLFNEEEKFKATTCIRICKGAKHMIRQEKGVLYSALALDQFLIRGDIDNDKIHNFNKTEKVQNKDH